MAKCLVEHGADPNLKDYYQCRPGLEQMDSWFIPSFRVGCEVDDYGNEPEVDTAVKRDAAHRASGIDPRRRPSETQRTKHAIERRVEGDDVYAGAAGTC